MSSEFGVTAQVVATVYARITDEQWATLASPGLLRRGRKDLSAHTPTLAGQTGESVPIDVGEHRVTLAASGPDRAACSCPAIGICRHIVTAGLWLGSLGEQTDSGPVGAASDSRPDRAEDLPSAGPPPQRGPGPRSSPARERRSADHARLRASIRTLLSDTVALGTAHVSDSMTARFRAAAISAQTADHFRLAALLRRIADHCAQIVARTAGAGESHVAEDLSIALALLTALAAAGEPAPERLRGVGRGAYLAIGDVDLVGLGSYPWRTASGYQGVTAAFYAPEHQRFLTVSDARPRHTPDTFDADAIYHRRSPVWPGLVSLSAATGAHVALHDARVSDSGRLSRGAETTALVTVTEIGAMRAQLHPIRRWAHLGADTGRPLLDPPDPNQAWTVMAPSDFGEMEFDEVTQTLHWTLADDVGATLDATLPYSDVTAHAVARLRHLPAPRPGTLVVGRLTNGTDLAVEPISLIPPTDAPDDVVVDALHFAPAGPSATSDPRPAGTSRAAIPSSAGTALVDSLQGHLIRAIERGTTGRDAAVRSELAQLLTSMRAAGLTLFAPPADDVPTPELLLRTYAVTLQLRRLR
ncbi:hypothetical protein QSJ18_07520 [Gordonia sp. ABSL1-1]|uniref:hypothetical protein n=1 Tax=Gordonia sp. ABSL1-1 TaxID=3053923 RepID=UPI00257361F8|nr:hypothetical protein [Gordonia sp. ABSL1-1]MDL9936588.1 hypothetical protein [Gordonia sp. ABSL1-1]